MTSYHIPGRGKALDRHAILNFTTRPGAPRAHDDMNDHPTHDGTASTISDPDTGFNLADFIVGLAGAVAVGILFGCLCYGIRMLTT